MSFNNIYSSFQLNRSLQLTLVNTLKPNLCDWETARSWRVRFGISIMSNGSRIRNHSVKQLILNSGIFPFLIIKVIHRIFHHLHHFLVLNPKLQIIEWVSLFLLLPGRYSCQVWNEVGDNEYTYDVVVFNPPYFTNTTLNQTTITVKEGENFTSECQVDGIPHPEVCFHLI